MLSQALGHGRITTVQTMPSQMLKASHTFECWLLLSKQHCVGVFKGVEDARDCR